MHLVFHLLFFVSLLASAAPGGSDSQPGSVRVRMHRNLDVFPQITSAKPKKIAPHIWLLPGQPSWNGKRLPARSFVFRRGDGKFDIIASVEFNEYLAGVIAHEVPLTWPREALRAQAVVARSYAIARMRERAADWYHLESDHEDQVFGLTQDVRVRAAVRDTEGVVLRKKNGMILKAFYHADCGGQTVSATSVWGEGADDAGTVRDPWCARRKSNRWSFETDRAEFFRQLGTREAAQYQISRFQDRVQNIWVGQKIFSVQKLREIIGYFKVRSAVNRLEITPHKVRLSGRGFGHGAGLCQWGTLDQAKSGRSYLQILRHYYPLAKITGKPRRKPTLVTRSSALPEAEPLSQTE